MENPVAKRLDGLMKLQQIDSKLDEINKIRGDLPEEVRDLEDEIAGYETRIAKIQEEMDVLNSDVSDFKQKTKDCEKLIEKYKKQQMDVRNNREFEAVSKEIDLQELDITLSKKKIKEIEAKVAHKQRAKDETDSKRSERVKDLENKRSELNGIIAESEEDEKKLLKEREKRAKGIEERLYRSYNKLRENAKNGLAVVSVDRGACGGCYNTVPPQRQADIRDRKKLIVCEHCGRVLADVTDPIVVEEKPKRTKRRGKKDEEDESAE